MYWSHPGTDLPHNPPVTDGVEDLVVEIVEWRLKNQSVHNLSLAPVLIILKIMDGSTGYSCTHAVTPQYQSRKFE